MNRTAVAAIFAVAALTLASVLVPVQSRASGEHQTPQAQRPWQRQLPLVEYNRDDVRDALRELIGNVGLSYTIDPAVQGTVSMSLHDTNFETALQNVLSQVDAEYRMEGGVIHVVRRSAMTVAAAVPKGPDLLSSDSPSNDGTVVVQDSSFLYVLRGTRMFKMRKSDLRVVAAGTVPR